MITFGSLFAGIGGFDLGLERAGMVCKWQVEINSYCQNVLAKHWPDVTRYGDVRDVERHNLYPVDLICGGFPCQPHSVAGKRRGATDDRNLWPEFIRVVKETKPRYVIAENVPGIVTTYIDTVLADLEGEGYTCWTFNIPAVAVDAPHRRERIWVVAHANSIIRRCDKGWQGEPVESSRQDVADATSDQSRGVFKPEISTDFGADGNRRRETSWWSAEQRVCGVDNGISQGLDGLDKTTKTPWYREWPEVPRVINGQVNRVDRLRSLGNAVVPQVAEWIGRQIVEYHER